MPILSGSARVVSFLYLMLFVTRMQGLTLSVAPPSVVATYSDEIEITIAAFAPATAAVKLQYFADLNGNGAVDPGEPLVHQIELKDGQRMEIGGIRNWNVSGDEDMPTNGVIRTEMRLAQLPELGRLAGKYVFRVTAGDGSAAVI